VNDTGQTLPDTTPPATVTNLDNRSAGTSWIYWNWTNPADSDFNHTEVWLNGTFKQNVSSPTNYYNATSLNSNTTYRIETRTADNSGNINTSWVNDTGQTLPPPDTTPPATVTNLNNQSAGPGWIYWNWTNPTDSDFNHTEIWINGTFKENVTKPTNYYNATSLNANKTYQIGTRTVDTSGNINTTWVNDTGMTKPKGPNCTDSDGDGFGATGSNLSDCARTAYFDCNDNNANILPPYNDMTIIQSTTLCNGTYYVNDSASYGAVRFGSSNLTLTCNGTILKGNNSGWGIFNYDVGIFYSNITVKDCRVENYGIGFYFASINNAKMMNNTAINNFNDGFVIEGNNTNLTNNFATNNNRTGIHVAIVSNATIQYNTIYNSTYGIRFLGESNKTNIQYNIILSRKSEAK
jgi:hypothetical protein